MGPKGTLAQVQMTYGGNRPVSKMWDDPKHLLDDCRGVVVMFQSSRLSNARTSGFAVAGVAKSAESKRSIP